MKILFILELYHPNIGGIERLFKTLAEELASKGHSVTIITSRFRDDLATEETINGVKIKRLKIRSRFLFTYFGVFGMLKEAGEVDIIHTTSYNAAFPARIAGCIKGKKVIITFHEAWGKLWFRMPYTNFIRKVLYYSYEWFILKLGFFRYVAVSDYTADSLVKLGVPASKVTRIYNGLVYEQFSEPAPASPAQFVFTFFGRLGISKGIDLIIDSVPDLLRRYPEICFKMIIPKHPVKILRRIEESFNEFSHDQFIMKHHLNDQELKKEIGSSSCIIIPSYSEGFCFAAAESIAMGIPVVTSGMGALKEVVSGKYITMKSLSGGGLSEAIEMAMQDAWEESPVKYYHFDNTIKEYLQLYDDLTKKM
ncbi:MAG TPA: glycosyltransferase family 4 protein [Bacteroidales bacterium]|nr:glycosyltransferase family 4 protein [Bacteroidales bacterium]